MDDQPPAKKARLSLACNECRRRKVKCDANYPKCRNCSVRDIECYTSDPKHPGLAVTREWIEPTIDQINKTGSPRPQTAQPGQSGGTGSSEEVSPAHQPHEMFFSRDHNRMKMMGASSSACLSHSLNLYLKRAGIKPVSDHFRHGMRYVEEVHLDLKLSLPAFPEADVREGYVNAYFNRIHRLWPLFDVDATRDGIDQLASMPDRSALAHENVPLLASAYLIMSLGADEQAGSTTEEGDLYLKAAASLMGHVMLITYLPTVQTLLLFTMAYRGVDKEGVAWQTCGMAVRVAQSLGLHKHSGIRPSADHGITKRYEQLFHARIWAICCCLEKNLQLESGRPSAIGLVTRDEMMGQQQRPPTLDYLQWNFAVAEYQARISEHIYGYRPGSRSSRQILLDTAKLDKSLLDWSNELPPDFHPGGDLFCADEDFHIAAHLSIQYHSAMIALHRAALIAPSEKFEAEVNKQCPTEPARFRLKGGETICIKSARCIARLMLEIADRKAFSRIFTVGPGLLACIVLAIYLTKHVTNRMQSSDLELLKASAEHVRDLYIKAGQDERFAQVAVAIYDSVRQYLARMKKRIDVRQVPVQQDLTSKVSPQSNASISVPPPAYQDVPNSALLSSENGHPFQQSWAQGGQSVPVMEGGSNPGLTFAEASSEVGFAPLQTTLTGEGGELALPFSDYNVEELWNWMLSVDAGLSPMESLGSHNQLSFM